MRTAVVVGALGVIGRYIVDHLLAEGQWRVVGLFHDCEDSKAMLVRMMGELRGRRIVP